MKHARTALIDEQNGKEVEILSFQRGIIEASGYVPSTCLPATPARNVAA
jgi:hypothetical protein